MLAVLGIFTITGAATTAYQMWSKNAFDARLYDLWIADRTTTPSSERGKAIIEAKNATQKAAILGVAGGAVGLCVLASAVWWLPLGSTKSKRMEEAHG